MFRVVQWATGQVGQLAVRAMLRDDRFKLVGAYVTTQAKVGADLGTLCGAEPIGIKATDSIEEILALDADCVLYCPLRPDLEEMCRILRSGKNLVTTVGYVYPKALGADIFGKLQAACKEGGTSLHGTGIHPGFSGDLLPVVLSKLSQSIDRIVVKEVADLRKHPSRKMVFEAMDFGRSIAETESKPDPYVELLGKIFRESQVMLADAIGVVPDKYTARHQLAAARERVEIACGVIEKGTVGGHLREWTAWVDGVPKIVFQSYWRAVDKLEPELDIRSEGYVNVRYEIVVDGVPSLRCSFAPSAVKLDGSACEADPGSMGRICTAMNAVNSIPQIVRAAPGVVTHLDLLGIAPRAR